jgi:hypothetical protein
VLQIHDTLVCSRSVYPCLRLIDLDSDPDLDLDRVIFAIDQQDTNKNLI